MASLRPVAEFVAVFVGGLVLVAAGLLAVALHVSHRTPHPHDNASFRYGERVMDRRIYGDAHVASFDAACRAALRHPTHPPPGLDVDKAVAGCEYQEYWEDH